MTLPRPGHADLPGVLKYGHADVRDALERASARHTAVFVAAGSVAEGSCSRQIGIEVRGEAVPEDGADPAAVDAAREGPGHARRRRRGARHRRPARARLLRLARAAARRPARLGADGDPGGEGGRDRRGPRALAPARLGGARRDPPRRRPRLLPGDQPCRRDRGRDVERRGDRRPLRDEAAADADEATRVRRPADGAARAGARRAQRRLRGRGAGGRRGGRGRARAGAGGAGEVRRRRDRGLRRRLAGLPGAHGLASTRAEPPPRADRLHGRGQVDAGRRGGRAARPGVRRRRRAVRGRARADPRVLRAARRGVVPGARRRSARRRCCRAASRR